MRRSSHGAVPESDVAIFRRKHPPKAVPEDQMADVRMAASAAARFLRESGYRDDFSEESLADADAFLAICLATSQGPDRQTLAGAFGCYLGETLRRCLDAQWVFDASDDLEVRTPKGSRAFPVTIVAKKLRPEGDWKSLAAVPQANRAIEERALSAKET